jgi:hypothetical protein
MFNTYQNTTGQVDRRAKGEEIINRGKELINLITLRINKGKIKTNKKQSIYARH